MIAQDSDHRNSAEASGFMVSLFGIKAPFDVGKSNTPMPDYRLTPAPKSSIRGW